MKYKFLSHTADVKFNAFGNSLEEVFINSALALSASIYEGKIKESKNKTIRVTGSDLENLLYNFLEEFLVFFDSENFILSNVKNLKIKEKGDEYLLESEFTGDDVSKYETGNHVKAITYSEMFVKKTGNKWIVQVVLDV